MLKTWLSKIARSTFLSLCLIVLVYPSVASAQEGITQLDFPFYDPNSSATACSTDSGGSTQPPSSTGSVYILGDSITVRAQDAYTKAFQQNGQTVTVDGSSSRSWTANGTDGNKLNGMDALDMDKTDIVNASTVIIALGTNGGNSADSISKAIGVVRADNPNASIYWVDTFGLVGSPFGDSGMASANSAIYSQSKAQNYQVISWAKAVDPNVDPSNPGGKQTDSNGYISTASADRGVHPTYDKGVPALVNLVYTAVTGSATTTTSSSSTIDNSSTASNSSTGSSSSLQMQTVDLSNFHPDPKAVSLFNTQGLPQIKKFIPLYIQAAQAEGVGQNWEILAGLHWPETSFGDTWISNSLGYTGPFQEGPSELSGYLDNSQYKDILSTLVGPGGSVISVKGNLSNDQFIVLARLAFQHWVQGAQGINYSALKQGPVPFSPTVDGNNTFWQIIHRWNSGDEAAEGFNGYDSNTWHLGQLYQGSPITSSDGLATTYYLLKQWEAAGGMNTISLNETTSSDCSSTTDSSGSLDCTNSSGTTAILCEAQKYKGIYYTSGGGHAGYKAFLANCPASVLGTAATASTIGNPGPCATDCSGLVSIAVSTVFKTDLTWVVQNGVMLSGSAGTDWDELPDISQVQPGDIVTENDHVEIAVSYDKSTGNLVSFGSHKTGTKTGTVTTKNYFVRAFRYVGPGT